MSEHQFFTIRDPLEPDQEELLLLRSSPGSVHLHPIMHVDIVALVFVLVFLVAVARSRQFGGGSWRQMTVHESPRRFWSLRSTFSCSSTDLRRRRRPQTSVGPRSGTPAPLWGADTA